MRQYARHHTGEEVVALAKAGSIPFDADLYAEGSDHILLYMDGPNEVAYCPVLYNVFSGRFFCAYEGFPHFNSDQQHDGEPWFDALLDFFYTNEPHPDEPRRMTVPAHCMDEDFMAEIEQRGITVVDQSQAPYAVTFQGTAAALQQAYADLWGDPDPFPGFDKEPGAHSACSGTTAGPT